jgi:hypothetical protein
VTELERYERVRSRVGIAKLDRYTLFVQRSGAIGALAPTHKRAGQNWQGYVKTPRTGRRPTKWDR